MESKKWHRERHRARVAEASKRYKERHPDRVAEASKRYREKHRAHLAELQKRYWEKHRARVAESKKRYRENNQEQLLAYEQRYRETHRELLREKERCRRARLVEKKACLVEKKRTAEKLNALGPLTLTIPLTDCLKSGHIPVMTYVKAFCDLLESVDTSVSPTESFVQLLEEDSHTLINLDSGAIEVREPPDCDLDDLSFCRTYRLTSGPSCWRMSRILPLIWRHWCPLKVLLICWRTCRRATRASICCMIWCLNPRLSIWQNIQSSQYLAEHSIVSVYGRTLYHCGRTFESCVGCDNS